MPKEGQGLGMPGDGDMACHYASDGESRSTFRE